MDNIVWQPINLDSKDASFAVYLDRVFAERMVSSKLDNFKGQRLNEIVKEQLGNKFFNPHIQFYLDTALADGFHLGMGGVWLAIDGTYGKNPLDVYKGLIEYQSHNIDTTTNRDALMRMFDMYIKYSDIIIE